MDRLKKSGFTLIELILVIVLIAALAASTYALINPQKRFKENRNAQRTADVNSILSATYQYYVDNDGIIPPIIQENADCFSEAAHTGICKSDIAGLTCTVAGYISLSDLTTNEKYLSAIPIDPTGESTYGTGYFVVKNVNSKLTVCAPSAEDTVISISR